MKFFSPNELSEVLGLSPDHLARMRMHGIGPRFMKIGDGRSGVIRYRDSDVEAWIESRMRANTVEPLAVSNRSFEA